MKKDNEVFKKSVCSFIGIFLLFAVSNYLFDCIYRPSNIDAVRAISIALGVTLGSALVYLYIKKRLK